MRLRGQATRAPAPLRPPLRSAHSAPRGAGRGGARRARGRGSAGRTCTAILPGAPTDRWRRPAPHARLLLVSHPSLGLPPPDLTAGRPAAAEAIRVARARLAARALEVAIDTDPTIRTRHDELALRRLLHDAEVLLDQVAGRGQATSALSPSGREVVPVFRRRTPRWMISSRFAEGADGRSSRRSCGRGRHRAGGDRRAIRVPR
jgi:hypothetical protein